MSDEIQDQGADNGKKKQIGVPEDLHTELKIEAARRGMVLTDYVTEILENRNREGVAA